MAYCIGFPWSVYCGGILIFSSTVPLRVRTSRPPCEADGNASNDLLRYLLSLRLMDECRGTCKVDDRREPRCVYVHIWRNVKYGADMELVRLWP